MRPAAEKPLPIAGASAPGIRIGFFGGNGAMEQDEERKLHEGIGFLGIRAQATMVGFVKLADELVRAGVIDQAALDRIKDAIVKELSLTRPPASPREDFERNTRRRLDALFAGDEKVGPIPSERTTA